MKQGPAEPQPREEKVPALPIGQHEGEGSNAVQHKPDLEAEPVPDGRHRYEPRTGYPHGND